MELVRIAIQAPTDGEVWVIAVGPTSAAEDLSTLPYLGLSQAISNGTPLMIAAVSPSNQPVFYRFGQASGMVDENSIATATGTANRQAAVKSSTVPPVLPEMPPPNSRFLMHKTPSGAPTATLRIWASG